MNNAVQTSSSASSASSAVSQRPGSGLDTPQAPFVVPPVDVFETDASITLLADLPGVAREQLHVRVDGDTLLLEATAGNSGPENMQLVYGRRSAPPTAASSP
jgi:HSP20 family protein